MMSIKHLLQLKLLIICTALTNCMQNGELDQATIQLHTGVAWRTLPERHYDSIFPLNFELPWGNPAMAELEKGDVSHEDTLKDALFDSLHNLTTDWDQGLNSLQLNLESSVNGRQKRGFAVLGRFAHYCCNLISEETLGSMAVSQSALNDALGKFQNHFGEILNNISFDNSKIETFSRSVASNMKTFNSSMGTISNSLKSISDEIILLEESSGRSEKYFHSFAEVIQRMMHGNYKLLTVIEEHSVIRQCNAKRIPRELISVDILQQKLTSLSTEANKFNRELIEPASNIDKYYFMNIVTCFFTPKKVLVRISVPLVNRANSWRAVRIYPIGFLWHGSTCKVDVKGRKFLVSKTGMVKKADSLSCSNDLCYAGRVHLAPQDEEEKCVAALRTKQTEDITKSCKLVCKNEPELKVIEMEEVNRFMISNADESTKMVCKGLNDSALNTVTGVGAHLVDVPCQCQIFHNDLVVVDSHFPCDSGANRSAKAALVVPTFWTKPEVHLMSVEFKVHDVKQHVHTILKLDWPKAMQVLNLSRPVAEPMRLLPGFKIEGYISFDWLLFCVLLQLVVGIYVLYLHPVLILPPCLMKKLNLQERNAATLHVLGAVSGPVENAGNIYEIVKGRPGNSGNRGHIVQDLI